MSGGTVPSYPWWLHGPLTWTRRGLEVSGGLLSKKQIKDRLEIERRVQWRRYGRVKPRIRVQSPGVKDDAA